MKYFMLDYIIVKDEKLVQAFYIGYQNERKTYILNGGEYKEVLENYQWNPTFYIPITSLINDGIGQAMLDCLIAKKIIPTIPIKNKDQLEAIKYHLEDMRKLVFNKKENKNAIK
jgi:hypothetical protein